MNTGVIWLWDIRDHIGFDLHERWGSHVAYESDEEFESEAQKLVQNAADVLLAYRKRIVSPEVAANQLLEHPSPANFLAAGMAFALER